jgi:hypothetical protein
MYAVLLFIPSIILYINRIITAISYYYIVYFNYFLCCVGTCFRHVKMYTPKTQKPNASNIRLGRLSQINCIRHQDRAKRGRGERYFFLGFFEIIDHNIAGVFEQHLTRVTDGRFCTSLVNDVILCYNIL